MVLCPSCEEVMKEKFEAQLDTVTDFAEFGYVIKIGLGKEPPDDIKEAVGKCGPSYYFKPYFKHLFGLHNTFSLQHLHIMHHLLTYIY